MLPNRSSPNGVNCPKAMELDENITQAQSVVEDMPEPPTLVVGNQLRKEVANKVNPIFPLNLSVSFPTRDTLVPDFAKGQNPIDHGSAFSREVFESHISIIDSKLTKFDPKEDSSYIPQYSDHILNATQPTKDTGSCEG